MEDFFLLSPQDRQDMSYAMCVGGTGLVGVAVGRFAGLPGLLAGAIAGVAYGLLACKKLSPLIERKLFSRMDRLSDGEILQVLGVLQRDAGVSSKADGMYVLAQVRHAAATRGLDPLRPPNSCMPLRPAAAHLLAARAVSSRG
jgi:hypothetical protein